MSQRALKKREQSLQRHERETHQKYRKQPQTMTTQKSKYTQRTISNSIHNKHSTMKTNQSDNQLKSNVQMSKQKFSSTPNLATIIEDDELLDREQLVRSHSESDLTSIPDAKVLIHAKSEFHLQSIQSTHVPQLSLQTMFPSVHNVRLAVESSPQTCVDGPMNIQSSLKSLQLSMSKSVCRQMSSSQTSSGSNSSISSTVKSSDAETIRIPIIGYEVMEERARFTVYKLRIENPFTNDCWVVLRRYNDFQRLNNKIKSMFPQLPALTLPRKKLFGDNFSSLFLSNRVQGLQKFINSVLANDTLRHSKPVRDFFCLDEPPTYLDNIEECRAIFEAQEDTISNLKLQLRAKDETMALLQKELDAEAVKNEALSAAIRFSYENCMNCSKRFDDLMKCQVTDGL